MAPGGGGATNPGFPGNRGGLWVVSGGARRLGVADSTLRVAEDSALGRRSRADIGASRQPEKSCQAQTSRMNPKLEARPPRFCGTGRNRGAPRDEGMKPGLKKHLR